MLEEHVNLRASALTQHRNTLNPSKLPEIKGVWVEMFAYPVSAMGGNFQSVLIIPFQAELPGASSTLLWMVSHLYVCYAHSTGLL